MHTIRDCNYCGKDYMFHRLETEFKEICQECSEKFVVIEDFQSQDNMATMLAYDYKKHDCGNPILYFGNQSECHEYVVRVKYHNIEIEN
jgi:hypothetical protein